MRRAILLVLTGLVAGCEDQLAASQAISATLWASRKAWWCSRWACRRATTKLAA